MGRIATAILERIFPCDREDRGVAIAAAAIWVVVLVLSLGYATLQPVWSVVDEGPHFGYVELIAEHGELPRAGDTVVSEKVLAIGRDRQWGWQYPRDPALRLDSGVPPAGTPEKDMSQWVRDNLWRFNYEAIQPPLYYLLAAGVYLATPGSTIAKVYAVRIFSAVLASLVVIFTYRLARRIAPGSRLMLIGAPASFLVLQGYLLNSSQVTNDSLAAVMGAVLVLLLVVFWQTHPEDIDRPALVAGGAVLGLALLTKSVLWPFLPIACLIFALRLGVRLGVRKLLPLLATSGAMFGPWLLRNLFVYGEATGQSRMSAFLGAFFPAPRLESVASVFGYVLSSSRHMLLSYIWGEPTWVWAYRRYNLVAAFVVWGAALAGWVVWLLRRRAVSSQSRIFERHTDSATLRMQSLLISVGCILAAYLFMLALPLLGGIALVGRYMYPVAAPVSVATVFGVSSLLKGPRLRMVVASALLAVFVVLNAVNLVGWSESGRATSRVADGLTYLQSVAEPRTRWYFGPGRNEGGFVDLVYLFNPTEIAASVNLNYFPGGNTVGVRRAVVLPRQGVTINTRFDRGGGYGAGHLALGIVIDSDIPILASRGSFFFVSDRGWTGGSISTGAPEPVSEAYFAAGRTGEGFSQVLGFLNPSDREARVSIEYVADGRSIERTIVVPPRSPLRVEASSSARTGGIGEPANYLSTIVRSSEPVVVERQLYYSTGGVSGGDWSKPVALSKEGVFPVVFSGAGYDPTLVAFNPAPDSAKLVLEYRLQGRNPEIREIQLPHGRTDVDLDIESGPGLGVRSGVYSLWVKSSHPVALELESLVQDGAFSDGYIQPSIPRPNKRLAFPFATTNPDFRSELVLFNPSGREATVTLEYHPSRLIWLASSLETERSKTVVLEPGEVRKVDLRESPEGVSATEDTAIVVSSDQEIFAGGALFFVHSF